MVLISLNLELNLQIKKGWVNFITDKPRKNMKSEINKFRRDEPADIVDEIKVEPRMKLHQKTKNRFQRMIDTRKEEKYLRDQAKLKRPYIVNKRNMENRWVAEQKMELEEPMEEEPTLLNETTVSDEIENEIEEEADYIPKI